MQPTIAKLLMENFDSYGFDIGQRRTGFASFHMNNLFVAAYESENTFPSRYDYAKRSVYTCEHHANKRGSFFAVVEGYTNMPKSFTAFGIGENGGIYRTLLKMRGFDILNCPVSSMRYFFGMLPGKKYKRSGKEVIADELERLIEWRSEASIKKVREDETDAVAYAFIGLAFQAALSEDVYEFNQYEAKSISTMMKKGYYWKGS